LFGSVPERWVVLFIGTFLSVLFYRYLTVCKCCNYNCFRFWFWFWSHLI